MTRKTTISHGPTAPSAHPRESVAAHLQTEGDKPHAEEFTRAVEVPIRPLDEFEADPVSSVVPAPKIGVSRRHLRRREQRHRLRRVRQLRRTDGAGPLPEVQSLDALEAV